MSPVSHTSLTFCRLLESEAHRSPPGLTAVLAETNARGAIYDAMQARRCYPACGERIWLDVSCGGLPMGQAGRLHESGGLKVRAEFAAESEIASVEVIRNGEGVHRVTPGDWKGSLERIDTRVSDVAPIADSATGAPMVCYYVRVTAQADARAWSSPCWFSLKANA